MSSAVVAPPPAGDRVVYVLGVGRSGSTLLDLLLGNHPEVVGVGELGKLVPRGWIRRELCGCGRPGDECPFWAEVRRCWLGTRAGPGDLEAIWELQERFERIRAMPRLLAESGDPSRELEQYGALMRGLFAAIRRVAGRRVVVDSSKGPARALALALVLGDELSLVHLVRDPRGVAFSWAKAFRRNRERGVETDLAGRAWWRTALAWRLVNALAARVARRLPPGRRAFLRYEELAATPASALANLGGVLGLDLGGLERRLAAGEPLPVAHAIAGNRLRMEASFRIAADLEWQRAMAPGVKRWIARLAGIGAHEGGER
jgi:hypothetical protein